MRVIPVSFAAFALLLPAPAFGQTADKLLGTWRSTVKVGGLDHDVKVSRQGDEWKLDSTFLRNEQVVGSGVAYEVQLVGADLSFKHRLVKKPNASWNDSSDTQQLVWKGDRLEWVKGRERRLYFRTGFPEVVQAAPKVEPKTAPPEPKPAPTPTVTPMPMPTVPQTPKPTVPQTPKPNATPTPRPAPDAIPESFDGVWTGSIRNNETTTLRLEITMTSSGKGERFVVEGHLTSDGNFAGHFRTKSLPLDPKKDDLEFGVSWDDNPDGVRLGRSKMWLTRTKGGLALAALGSTWAPVTTLLRSPDATSSGDMPSSNPSSTTPPMVVADASEPKQTGKPPSGKRPSGKTSKVNVDLGPLLKKLPVTPVESTFDLNSQGFDFSSTAGRLFVTSTVENLGVLTVVDLESKKPLWTRDGLKTAYGYVHWSTMSADGKWVACHNGTLFDGNQISIFDAATGRPSTAHEGLKIRVSEAALHPSQPLLAAFHVKDFVLLDFKAGQVKWRFPREDMWGSLIFDPSGTRIAASGRDKKGGDRIVLRLFDAATGAQLHEFNEGWEGYVRSAFSPDSARIALWGGGKSAGRCMVTVFDVESKQVICRTPEFVANGFATHHVVDFLPDGKTITVLTGNHGVLLFNAETGKLKGIHSTKEMPRAVFAHADGERILAATQRDVSIFRVADAVDPAGSNP
jgi:hypothetical protein